MKENKWVEEDYTDNQSNQQDTNSLKNYVWSISPIKKN